MEIKENNSTKIVESLIDSIKENSREINTKDCTNLDEVIKKLQKLQKNQILDCYADYQGTRLYSLDINAEKAYNSVYGMSKTKYKEFNETANSNWKEYMKYLQDVYEYIAEGKLYIYPDNFQLWEEYCKENYNTSHIKTCIKIMSLVEAGMNANEVCYLLSKLDDCNQFDLVEIVETLLSFCKIGPEIYETLWGFVTEDQQIKVNNIKNLNAYCEKKYNNAVTLSK